MSKVYFSKDLLSAVKLFEAAGFETLIAPNDEIALKIHFGEPGNHAYLSPDLVKPIAEKIFSLNGKPFYTDCNTLYSGLRKTTKSHLDVAKQHGFTKELAGADSKIPEEEDFAVINTDYKHCKRIFLGGLVHRTNTLIALTHFKGHEVAGFGGTLKNLGMGLASRRGKLMQHQDCRNCAKAKECKKNETVEACWGGSPELVQEKMVEYAATSVKGKKAGYINFVNKVSPNCDCYPFNDPPIVPDIGVLVSLDPVALDQASYDLVNKAEGRIKSQNKFKALYPKVNPETQLRYAEELGMGHREYTLLDALKP